MSETVKPKVTRLERINAILDKLTIPEQLDLWFDVGTAIHERIEAKKNQKKEEVEILSDLQSQLSKKQ